LENDVQKKMYKIRASIRIESALGKGVCKFHRIGSTSGKKRKAEKSKKAAKKKKKRRDDSDLSEQVMMRNLCLVLENKRLAFFSTGISETVPRIFCCRRARVLGINVTGE
jgi:hypothetical protein